MIIRTPEQAGDLPIPVSYDESDGIAYGEHDCYCPKSKRLRQDVDYSYIRPGGRIHPLKVI